MTRTINETIAAIRPAFDAALDEAIRGRWDQLTKPPGSLGRLEEVVRWYGCARGEARPVVPQAAMYIFCADHGITAEGVSAYPAEVTALMVQNFVRGGAAINVLCRTLQIEPVIVDMGVKTPSPAGVIDCRVGPGTRNFLVEPAMSRGQAAAAVEAGIGLAGKAASHCQIAGIGEMGIGNTTSASAVFAAIAQVAPELTVGRGAGLDDAGVLHKRDVIASALARHRPDAGDALGVLAAVGGFEIAGMCGFVLGCAAHRLPVVVDGFIAGAAVLVARQLAPAAMDYCLFSHRSAEQGHQRMLAFLQAVPLLDLDLRLGEGSGAALGIDLLRTALRVYGEMATFQEAGIG